MTAAGPTGYEAALRALAARGRFGIRLGLGRTRGLLALLGDPQTTVRGALIAGTNGKGSVQALVSAVLGEAGYRVGQTPKPHLVEYRERLVVGGEPIGPDEFAALMGRVLAAAGRVPRRLGPPTEFEVVTAAAFTWFRERDVDLAVVEVGLGGRLDATNAWDGGVAAVTNVAMDHAELLGPTIPAIAREKAAILKRGDRAVTGATGEALAVVRRRARRLGVPLREVAPLPVVGMDRHGLRVEAPGIGEVRMRLLGRHQALNAAVALAIVDELEAAGLATADSSARRRGLEHAAWPGRLELIPVPPASGWSAHEGAHEGVDPHVRDRALDGGLRPDRVRAVGLVSADDLAGTGAHRPESAGIDLLLDGAHNPDGVAALVAAIRELRPSLAPGRPTVLLAIMRDKDVDSMLATLIGDSTLGDAHVVTTRVGERGLDAADLGARVDRAREVAQWTARARSRPGGPGGEPRGGAGARPFRGADPSDRAVPVPEPADALDAALEQAARDGGPLIVAGSLYLVGTVRGILQARGLVR